MLYLNKTKIAASKSMTPVAGVTLADEGIALIAVNNGGKVGVRPSTGAANEVFAGIATFERRAPTVLAAVKTFIGTDTATDYVLPNYVNGTARITVNGGAVNGGTPEATLNQSTGVLTVTTAGDGATIQVTYAYTPTVLEVERKIGTTQASTPLTYGADVGVIYQGEVFTSNFDTTSAWVAGGTIRLGANGVFTLSGTGTIIPNAFVSAVPTESEPYLGIELR